MIDAWTTGLIAVALALSVPAVAAAATAPGPVMVAQTEAAVDRDLIGNIQRLLGERGLDPGPADGVMGPKTRNAIAAYQEAAGLPADGLPSQRLYERLRAGPDALSAEQGEDSALPGAQDDSTTASGPPAAEDTALPPPEPQNAAVQQDSVDRPPVRSASPAVPSLTGSIWRFADATGSAFMLAFTAAGKVEGVLYERFWSWRQSGDAVVVTYDNGMGLTVTRSGRLSGPAAMSGTAQPSRGDPWNWTAERIARADPAAEPAN